MKVICHSTRGIQALCPPYTAPLTLNKEYEVISICSIRGYKIRNDLGCCVWYTVTNVEVVEEKRKVIGWKLLKPQRENLIIRALGNYQSHSDKMFLIAGQLSYYVPRLEALGILDWFEPVYEDVNPFKEIKLGQCGDTEELIRVFKNGFVLTMNTCNVPFNKMREILKAYAELNNIKNEQ